MQSSQEPICQSCGMPVKKNEDFGTNADGSKSENYCCIRDRVKSFLATFIRVCNPRKSQFVKVVVCRLKRMKILVPMLTEVKVKIIVFTAFRRATFWMRE